MKIFQTALVNGLSRQRLVLRNPASALWHKSRYADVWFVVKDKTFAEGGPHG